jgi:hypothetical protein
MTHIYVKKPCAEAGGSSPYIPFFKAFAGKEKWVI